MMPCFLEKLYNQAHLNYIVTNDAKKRGLAVILNCWTYILIFGTKIESIDRSKKHKNRENYKIVKFAINLLKYNTYETEDF